MDKVVWTAIAVLCFALAGFMVYLTVDNPEVPIRGFAIAGIIAAVGVVTLMRLKSPRPPK